MIGFVSRVDLEVRQHEKAQRAKEAAERKNYLTPPNEVFETIMTEFLDRNPEARDDPRLSLLKEEFRNLVDVAVTQRFAEHQLKDKEYDHFDEPRFQELERFFKDTDRKSVLKKVHGLIKYSLSTVLRINVQTAHPTEFLHDDAIETIVELADKLFDLPLEDIKDPSSRKKVLDGSLPLLERLYTDLDKIPERKMTPIEETERGIRNAHKHYTKSVPLYMQKHKEALNRLEAKYGIKQTKHYSIEELRELYQVIILDAWDSSDRDNKPQVTVEVMREALNLNQEAILEWYDSDLEDLIESFAENADLGEPEDFYVYTELSSIRNELQENGYDDSILRRLETLKYEAEKNGFAFAPQTDSKGDKTGFTKLDTLLVKMGNFRGTAKKQQVRDNAEMHSNVYVELMARLYENNEERGWEVPFAEHIDKEKPLREEAARMLKYRDDFSSKIVNWIMEDDARRFYVREFIIEELEALEKTRPEDGFENQATEDYYQTMSGVRLFVDNPKLFSKYLIAEARSAGSLLQVFTFAKILVDPDIEKKEGFREIDTLCEHREDLANSGPLNHEAMLNKHFRRHHVEESKDDPRLFVFDPSPKYLLSDFKRRVTVAEWKQFSGIVINPGDEKKPLMGLKTLMSAGSDSFMGGGVLMGTHVVYSQRKATRIMIQGDEPIGVIGYHGFGGGNGRFANSQSPESTNGQGRNMRDMTPRMLVDQAIGIQTNLIGRMFGNQDQDLINQNPSFAIGYNGAPAGYNHLGEDRSQRLRRAIKSSMDDGIDAYQAWHQDPRVSVQMQHSTPSFMVGATNYSARKDARTGHNVEAEAYPKKMNHRKLRAIGNNLGHSAARGLPNLIHGAKESLRLDDNGGSSVQNIQDIAASFIGAPEVCDEQTRFSYGLALADRDFAWKFADVERTDDGQTLTTSEGVEYSLDELLELYDRKVGLKDSKDSEKVEIDVDYEAVPADIIAKYSKKGKELPPIEMIILAKDEADYQRVLPQMTEILLEVRRQSGMDNSRIRADMDPREKLLASMPNEMLARQIKEILPEIDKQSEILADIHQKAKNGEIDLVSEDISELSEESIEARRNMHFALATINSKVETLPTSLRYSGISMEMTKAYESQERALAA